MSFTVLIADDHPVVRQCLRRLLENEPDLDVVAEAGNCCETLHQTESFLPQVVVMDIKMGNLAGIRTVQSIVHNFPETKVLALSIYNDRRLVAKMLEEGVSGYVLKDYALEDLVQAIRKILSNTVYLGTGVEDASA